MRITSRQRYLVEQTLRGGRQAHRPDEGVKLYYPASEVACSTCGFNELSQSAMEPDCATCGGLGRIITYTIYTSHPRISWPKLSDFVVGIAGGIEVGDALLYIGADEKDQYVRHQGKGYLTIDGQRYQITALDPAGVGDSQEYVVTCARQTQ